MKPNLKKRQYRELSDPTKKKISQKLSGKKKSLTHKQNIAQALTTYWMAIPSKVKENNSNVDETK